MTFWGNVAAGVVATVLYTLVIATIILVFVVAAVRRSRRQLFEFLSIDPEHRTARIFLSRLDVLRAGSQGTDGRLAVGFTGPALMQLEYAGARALEHLLAGGFLEHLPPWIRRAIQRRSGVLGEVEVEIDVAPGPEVFHSILDKGAFSTVLLGSDVYSHAVRQIYTRDASFIRFVCEQSGRQFDASRRDHANPTFAVAGATGRWRKVPARSIGRELGTIQRVTIASGRQVVMCAGISASATCGTASYLCDHWRQLRSRFGDDDFLVVLAFREQEADSSILARAEELSDLARSRPIGT